MQVKIICAVCALRNWGTAWARITAGLKRRWFHTGPDAGNMGIGSPWIIQGAVATDGVSGKAEYLEVLNWVVLRQ